jgi:hypothetical protein
MANSDKNIIITPFISGVTQPQMKFVGQGNDPIYLKVLDGITGTGATAGGALSVEGSAGQLFSIVNRLGTGSIFSVNDISGIPIIDANASGDISLAGYFGNVGVGLTAPTAKFQVTGNAFVSGLVTAVSGVCAAGSTFSSTTNTLDIIASTDGVGLRIAQAATGSLSRLGGIRLGRSGTTAANTFMESSIGTFTIYNGVNATGSKIVDFTATATGFSGDVTATGLISAVKGISAAGGVTLAGTFSGATGSFSKLLTLSGGLSAAGGITFSSPLVLPLNTAPAITIGTSATKNLILSCVDGAGLIQTGGNTTASLTINQASGGPVVIGGAIGNAYLALYEDDNSAYLQSTNLFIGDADGVANNNNIHIDDAATTITATCGSFGVSGRLDMNGGYSEAGATASQATNTITFNAALGNTQKFVPSAVTNTVNFTNINTTSTQCTSATLIFLHGATPYGLTTGTFSVQLAGVTKTVKWSGGSAPVLTNTANKTDILNFLTYDGGTTWLGFVGGLNF